MSPNNKSYLVAIGGLDPSGHSGILADLRVFNNFGIPAKAAITALTAQSEKQFIAWQGVPLKLFQHQLDAVAGQVFGVKLGMLATTSHVHAILKWIGKIRPKFLLWDPVRFSSTGAKLLKVKDWHPLLEKLLQSADVLTPNYPEAKWILRRNLRNPTELETAIEELYHRGKKKFRWIVLKGGHEPGRSRRATDWLFNGKELVRLDAPRLPDTRRGTGCAFGSALLSGLYLGKGEFAAARLAKRYVLERVLHAPPSRLKAFEAELNLFAE